MDKKQASVTLLPVLPLRDVVVYPNMVIPLFVGRERSMKALELAMEGPDKQIVLLAQRSPDIDDPQTEDLYEIGTVATVIQLLKLPDGTIKVLVEGIQRIKASDIVLKDDTLMANAAEIEIVAVKDAREAEVAQRSLLSLFEQYVKSNRKLPPELLATLA
ncbi:MAG: LON peptidase substrate-binding domain-containing protein, partial [Gammaproteobacteria bacterium]